MQAMRRALAGGRARAGAGRRLQRRGCGGWRSSVGHVQGGADAGAAAQDHAAAAEAPLSRLIGATPTRAAILRRSRRAELGQLGDQGAGGDRADAGHRGEQVLGRAPGRGAADRVVEVAVERGELLLQPGEMARRGGAAAAGRGPGAGGWPSLVIISTSWRRRATSSPAPGPAASAAAAAPGGRARRSGRSPRRPARSVLASRPVARAKSRICRGLTTASGRPAAASAAGDRDLEAAGGLQHDQRRAPAATRRATSASRPASSRPTREGLARGPQMHVEAVLGDVDADEGRRSSRAAP